MTKISEYVIDVNDSSLLESIRNIGTYSARANILKKDIENLQASLKKLDEQGKKGTVEYRNQAEALGMLTAQQELNNAALKSQTESLKIHSKEAVGSANSYAAMKMKMAELQQEAGKLDLSLEASKVRFKAIQKELEGLAITTGTFDLAVKTSTGGITALTTSISQSFKSIGEGFQAASGAYSILKGYTGEIDVVEEGIKKVEQSMAAYSAVTKVANGITAVYTAVQSAATLATGGATVALNALKVAFMTNPIGLIIGGIAAAAAVLVTVFESGKEKAESFIETLKEKEKVQMEALKSKEQEIELMKAQGASEEAIIAKGIDLLVEKSNVQAGLIKDLEDRIKQSSGEGREILEKELAEMKKAETGYCNEIAIEYAKLNARKEQLNENFKDKMAELDEKIAGLQNTNHIEILQAKHARELEYLEENFKNHKDYATLKTKLEKSQLLEVEKLKNDLAAGNSPLKKLNDEISKLTDEVMNEFIAKGEASAKKLERLKLASEKLAEAQYKLSQETEKFNQALEGKKIEEKVKELQQQLKQEKEMIMNSMLDIADKEQQIRAAEYKAAEKEMELYKQMIWLDGEFTIEERTQLAIMEQKLSTIQQQINLATELANIDEGKKTDVEKEDDRYENRLKELGLFNVAEENMTEQQKKVLEALEQEHQDRLLEIAGANTQKDLTNIKTLAGQKLSLLEFAHQQELKKEGLSKKERTQLEKDFHAEKLAIQKEATQKQIEALESSLTTLSASDNGVALEGLDEETKMQIQAITIELNTLKTALDGLEDGDEERTAQIQERAQKAADAFGQMNDVLGYAEQISEVRLQNELARIDEKRQAEIDAVNASVLSEEEKKSRIDGINAKYDRQTEAKQKAAAKRDKAIAITKTIIAGAQAIAQGIAQFGPPPSPAGIAAIAAAAVTTATQIALIAKQKFAQGGYIPFETGGMIQGALHSQGGVPFSVGGKLMEAEGGELVVNRNIWSRPDFVKNISEMNALTGGKRFFAAGGMVPNSPKASPPAYVSTTTMPAEGFDSEMLVKGLRGVIAEEVGSLKIVNNVVDTTSQQQRLLNIQTGASF